MRRQIAGIDDILLKFAQIDVSAGKIAGIDVFVTKILSIIVGVKFTEIDVSSFRASDVNKPKLLVTCLCLSLSFSRGLFVRSFERSTTPVEPSGLDLRSNRFTFIYR